MGETIELESFDVNFSFRCPKCDYLNDEISVNDLTTGNAECAPREFTTIAVSDGIAMGHEGMKASLISREIIADSIEIMMRAHQYDGIVAISGCDKSLPGSLMAMARINLPSIFVYGGTIMPGNWNGKDLTIQDF